MPLEELLGACLSDHEIAVVRAQLEIAPPGSSADRSVVSRALLSQALTMVLFHDLLQRVPAARDYVTTDVVARGKRVVFDHGALRTVRCACGDLPAGEAAFTRILEPLGYRLQGVYPLPRLGMTAARTATRTDPRRSRSSSSRSCTRSGSPPPSRPP